MPTLSNCALVLLLPTTPIKKEQTRISLFWIAQQSENKQRTAGDVKEHLKLVLDSGHPLDVGQMEETSWQTGELVVGEVHLL